MLSRAVNGIMPLDVMLTYMRERYVADDMPTAHMAARDCAPYLHPRLSAAAVNITQKPADQSEEESKRQAIEAFIAAFGPRPRALPEPTETEPVSVSISDPEESDSIMPLDETSGSDGADDGANDKADGISAVTSTISET